MILRTVSRDEVLALFERHHAYAGISRSTTYLFGVEEPQGIVAAFAWQPPPPGSARSVCVEAPQGVLALSRMVAVPRSERALRHISKPLRRQMRKLIDRSRWPVLVTYSDEGLGHTGHVYKCSGWQPTLRSQRSQFVDDAGVRRSSYANGRSGHAHLRSIGRATIQRWEHWACGRGHADQWMSAHGWHRIPVPGKRWKSGSPAFTWVRGGAS